MEPEAKKSKIVNPPVKKTALVSQAFGDEVSGCTITTCFKCIIFTDLHPETFDGKVLLINNLI